MASKCEYHQTSPCRLFLTFPSLPFRALAAVVVVVCNTQLILFLFQLAILGRPGLPTFFFSLPEKKVQSQRGKKGGKKIQLGSYLLPGCSPETAAEGGHHHVLINNPCAFQLFDNCS